MSHIRLDQMLLKKVISNLTSITDFLIKQKRHYILRIYNLTIKDILLNKLRLGISVLFHYVYWMYIIVRIQKA